MTHPLRAYCMAAALAVCALFAAPTSGAQRESGASKGDKKPSLALKANPPGGFTPLRVHMIAELRGGADDYAEFYCPSIEWDWGDGTVSENSEDCDPYEAGRSKIRRRYTGDHTYRQADSYRAAFRVKQKTKVVAQGTVTLQVRAGVRDDVNDRFN